MCIFAAQMLYLIHFCKRKSRIKFVNISNV